MRLTIPLTGTVLVEGSVFGAGELSGDPNDPIRPIDINLGNVSWTMVDVDLENEIMVIEVKPVKIVSEDTGQVDGDGKRIFRQRLVTEEEKADSLQYAKQLVEGHTEEELYAMSKCSRLKRPFRKKKGNIHP